MGNINVLCIFLLCYSAHAYIPISLIKDKTLTRIAFGSCNKHDLPQEYWDSVVDFNPDLWLWLGDIVYADEQHFPTYWRPSPLEKVTEKYALQKQVPGYQRLRKTCPITGAWDDHDFNNNNGGNEYINREKVQDILLDFLDEPKDSPRWQRDGVYISHTFGPPGRRVKFIVLDSRFFRDANPDGVANHYGDMLGAAQWEWFQQELNNSDAQIHFISSGIQMIPHDKPVEEKWSNFPKSRAKLFQTLKDNKTPGVVLLSGDIHYGEILKTTCVGTKHPLYEMTSSGLTHSCGDIPYGICQWFLENVMRSRYHIAHYEYKNFGTILIDWDATPVKITLQLRDLNGTVQVEELVPLSDNYTPDPKDCAPEIVSSWVNFSADTLRNLIVKFVLFPGFFVTLYGCFVCCVRPSRPKVAARSAPTKKKKSLERPKDEVPSFKKKFQKKRQ
eukprot:TRINITY_DN2450_c0_g1_i1.p1 TRINITY_DN2450_c0_g1~~TRINITY_DN2450_c0_g1_i1.p1  ORF type:complete len:444 (+),score=54.98 TRINITY_DN2450_c0_g1_i1:77-1408(+)